MILKDFVGEDIEISDGRLSRVVPINRNRQTRVAEIAETKSKEPKNNFVEIPRYLMKITSTLFKKASAAEIFLNEMNKKNVKQAEGDNARNIIKIGADEQAESVKKEDRIQNLMSDKGSTRQLVKERRKSIEVLMKDNNLNIASSPPKFRFSSRANSIIEIPHKNRPQETNSHTLFFSNQAITQVTAYD